MWNLKTKAGPCESLFVKYYSKKKDTSCTWSHKAEKYLLPCLPDAGLSACCQQKQGIERMRFTWHGQIFLGKGTRLIFHTLWGPAEGCLQWNTGNCGWCVTADVQRLLVQKWVMCRVFARGTWEGDGSVWASSPRAPFIFMTGPAREDFPKAVK